MENVFLVTIMDLSVGAAGRNAAAARSIEKEIAHVTYPARNYIRLTLD